MRPARALSPSRLVGLMLLALTTTTTGNYQGTLICKQPETQVCLSWLVHSDELQNFNNADTFTIRARENCGFTKMRALSPYQKFYKVSQLMKNKPPKTLHCKRIILIGPFVDCVEINFALGGMVRVRRQTFTPRGRYRGQTQSQYLAIDRGNGKDEGKAEAHSAADSSRASVSGNSGMGQAQSQTIYDPNCEDCYGRPQVEVENLKHPGSSKPVGNGHGQSTGYTWPGAAHDHGTGPNDIKDLRPPGLYGRPTSDNGNMVGNNGPINLGTNGYGPDNKGNIGGYGPIGSGTTGYKPFDNGAYDPNRAGQGPGIGPGQGQGVGLGQGERVRPSYGQGVGPSQGQGVGPSYGQGVGPGQGQRVEPAYGQGIEPGEGQGGGPGQGQGGGPGQGQVGGPGHGQGGGPGHGQVVGPSYDQVGRPGQGPGVGPGYGQGGGPGGPGQGHGVRPGYGQGARPAYGQGVGPRQGVDSGYGQGVGPGQGQVVGPGYGQGVRPGQEQSLGPGQEQGVRPGYGQGAGPAYGQGVRPGQGIDSGYGQGVGPGQGKGVGPGYEQGVGPGQEQGLGPGQEQGVRPGYEQGAGPAYGQSVGPGQGVDSGYSKGVGPGQEQGVGPGQGQGVGPSYGQGVEPGYGQGVGPGQEQGVRPGYEQGAGPAYGQSVGPGGVDSGYSKGVRPGQEQGVRPGQGQGVGPGYGQGVEPGYGQGVGPGYGQGVGPGQGKGLGPGQGQGVKPSYGQGAGPAYGQGVGPGQGVDSGYGQGVGPDQGQRVGPGYGQGVGTGQEQGVRPGYEQGARPAYEKGVGPEQGVDSGYSKGVGPGQEQGVGPGQGQGVGVGPGYGQGVGPGQGKGLGPGQEQGVRPGYGQGAGPGQGPGLGPGYSQGGRPGQGPGVGPGYSQRGVPGQGQGVGPNQGQGGGSGQGQVVRPGYGQGVGPGQGQGVGLGQGQGVGPSQGQGVGSGQGQGPSQGKVVGPGYGQGIEPDQGHGVGPGQEQGVGPGNGYRPYQNGLGIGPKGDSNWPMASGPYAGPGGSKYYCCFIPNTGSNSNLYANNYGKPNTIYSQSNVPGGQLESGFNGPNLVTNQYGTSNTPSMPQSPESQYSMRPLAPGGHLGTGLSNVPSSGIQYTRGPGGKSILTQPNQYGTDFHTASPLKPGGQLATGLSNGLNKGSQYDPSMSTNMKPSNFETGIDSTRPLIPIGQIGAGISNVPVVGSPYGSNLEPGNLPNKQIGTGSGTSLPGAQFSTSGGNLPHQQYGKYNPNESNGRNMDGIYNGQSIPVNQYNTGTDGISKGLYSDPNTSFRQYGTGTPTTQNISGTQVGPGAYIGQHGPGLQVGPLDNSGLTSSGQQYGKGPYGSGTNPAEGPHIIGEVQNGPVGTDTANYPGNLYGSGSLSGPEKSYGLGPSGSNTPIAYPGDRNVQGQPYGPDLVKVPSYGTGNYNSNIPGGSYQGGNKGGGNEGPNNGQGGGDNHNRAPIDGTSESHYDPYNQRASGVQNNEYSGGPQNYIDPNSIDGDDSEAEASVAQGINGTIASASSKGGNDKGRAQTNVHGTYTGSGSFQAQAQITGDNKEAQSEVSGGKKGASSTASGSGRNNKSQASVQLGSETGSVQTQSQSAGVMHSSNSQVQGSVKGGMADAQAKGPGSTSSQAQIGFSPYKNTDKSSHDLQKTPFSGGGVASAQSSGRTGQSQSQLHGTFKYGITYNGAAQSGASLDKDAVFPNRLSFEKIDVFDENEKNVNIDITETPLSLSTEVEPSSTSESYDLTNEAEITTTENVLDDTMLNTESSHTHSDHHKTDNSYLSGPTLSGTKKSFSTNHINNPGTDYEYSTVKEDLPPESEYDTDEPFNADGSEESDLMQGEYSNYDEFTRESPTHQSLLSSNRKPLEVRQSTGGNTQHIVLGSLKNHNAKIIQKNSDLPDENKVYLAGERIPGTGGYTVPAGFRGSVKSVSSKDNTYVVGYRDSPSQAQTVTLTPGTGRVKYMYPPAYGKHVMPKNLRSLYSPKEDNKYLSVSKSVTRALDDENNIRKQYSHTYYTKSSSCGYFTFTCTMVSSAEGRKKVCKPKIPTNPDGTKIRC